MQTHPAKANSCGQRTRKSPLTEGIRSAAIPSGHSCDYCGMDKNGSTHPGCILCRAHEQEITTAVGVDILQQLLTNRLESIAVE